MLQYHIFGSKETYFEPDLLDEIKKNVVDFEVTDVNDRRFRPSPEGTYNSEDYLVVPEWVDIYIDPSFVKPDGSPVKTSDLHRSLTFGNGFHQGSFGVYYDYEYVLTPAIWFTVDADVYAETVDSHVSKISRLIKSQMVECEEFRKTHGLEEYTPCP